MKYDTKIECSKPTHAWPQAVHDDYHGLEIFHLASSDVRKSNSQLKVTVIYGD